MIDNTLVRQYVSAVQARLIIAQLPSGVREIAQQFEPMVLADIRAQSGNPNLTEQEILDMIKPTFADIAKKYLPVVADYAMTAIKKHYPTATISTVLSALISYLMTQK